MKQQLLKLILMVIGISMQHSTTAQNWRDKIEPIVLQNLAHEAQTEVFVVMNAPAPDLSAAQHFSTKNAKTQYVFDVLTQHAQKSQTDIQKYLKVQHIDFQSFWLINSIFLKTNQKNMEQIAKRADVLKIVNNPHSKLDAPMEWQQNLPPLPKNAADTSWGIKIIGADSVWATGVTGEGVTVGGADTGYDWTHPALRPKYRGNLGNGIIDHNYNWHDAIHVDSTQNPCGVNTVAPCDDNAHGTHTMGSMVGGTANTVTGVAPNALWIAARNMNSGNGSLASYIECFEWFVAPTDLSNRLPMPRLAPHVINNSWYCATSEGCNASNFALMERAVLATRSAGIVVVVSAGNSGPNCQTITGPPAFFAPSFTVGATRQDDTIANFSSRGSIAIDGSGRMKPDISAPGVGILSTIPNGGYASYSGTSMAGPHVAGLVALMISANPRLAGQVDTLENIIEQTAKPMQAVQNCGNVQGTSIPNNTYGWGRIDARRAVARAQAWRPRPNANQEVFMQNEIKVFPNPTNSILNFDFSENILTQQLEIWNLNGQLLKNVTIQRHQQFLQIDVSDLENGLYIWRIESENQTWRGKFLVNR